MAGDSDDPKEFGDDEEVVDEAIEDEVDDELEAEERLSVSRREFADVEVDPDEAEADDELLLDRKELSEIGSELDNPDGFADE
jgi:hypothetical protein